MPKQLDAVADVQRAATVAATFDHYRLTKFSYERPDPNGAGRLLVEVVPCRDTGGGVCQLHRQGKVQINIPDPITEAEAAPAGEMQLMLDAILELVATKSALVNTAVI